MTKTEAVILAGGNSWRLRPQTDIPKPLLPFGRQTLLDLQIKWLLKYNFDKVVITTTREVAEKVQLVDNKVYFSLEQEKLGTAGAVKRALLFLNNTYVYVFNVDDLVLQSNPVDLVEKARDRGSALLVSKPRLGFGRIQTRQDLAIRFQEKPILDFYVSCGHYAFRKDLIQQFPDTGDLEREVLPKLASDRQLSIIRWKGRWDTVNTWKDYVQALQGII